MTLGSQCPNSPSACCLDKLIRKPGPWDVSIQRNIRTQAADPNHRQHRRPAFSPGLLEQLSFLPGSCPARSRKLHDDNNRHSVCAWGMRVASSVLTSRPNFGCEKIKRSSFEVRNPVSGTQVVWMRRDLRSLWEDGRWVAPQSSPGSETGRT